jgi:hypothetical protein
MRQVVASSPVLQPLLHDALRAREVEGEWYLRAGVRAELRALAYGGTHVALVANGVEPAVEVVHIAREAVDKEIPRGGGEYCFGEQADGDFNWHDHAVLDEAGGGVRGGGSGSGVDALVDHLPLLRTRCHLLLREGYSAQESTVATTLTSSLNRSPALRCWGNRYTWSLAKQSSLTCQPYASCILEHCKNGLADSNYRVLKKR